MIMDGQIKARLLVGKRATKNCTNLRLHEKIPSIGIPGQR